MKAEILKTESLIGINSVSGIEVINGMIYLTSNNGLLCLDPFLNIKCTISLSDTAAIYNSICSLYIDTYPYILVLGESNSKPQAWLVKLPTPYNRKHKVWTKELNDLYQLFDIFGSTSGENAVNVISRGSDFIALFDTVENTAYFYHLDEFKEYIQSHSDAAPFPSSTTFQLPQEASLHLNDTIIYDNRLFFTLQSTSAKQSYIGCATANSFNQIRGSESKPDLNIEQFCSISQKNIPVAKRASSLAISEQLSDSSFTALAVFNHDDKDTEIALIDLEI